MLLCHGCFILDGTSVYHLIALFAVSVCANTQQFWTGKFYEKVLFPAAIIEPGTAAGYEVRTLPP